MSFVTIIIPLFYYDYNLVEFFLNIHLADAVRSFWSTPMQWTKPAFQDIRIGFEITMYFEAR